MKCLVIDDEPFALDLIKRYIEKTPYIDLKGAFTNPIKAMEFLNTQEIDLIFLDINMPELSGIQLLNSLTSQPLVIFTTAYAEYGAESYEYSAVDYLLKPVKYERFLKAVNKAIDMNTKVPPSGNSEIVEKHNSEKDFVYIKSGTRHHKIKLDEVLYVEGAGNYTTFYIGKQKILTLLKMSEVLELLPDSDFKRIHKSYIISIKHMDIIEKHQVIIRGNQIPIGVTYREMFFQHFIKEC